MVSCLRQKDQTLAKKFIDSRDFESLVELIQSNIEFFTRVAAHDREARETLSSLFYFEDITEEYLRIINIEQEDDY